MLTWTPLSPLSSCVDCTTQENRTMDLFYANTKDAYSAPALPLLGRSDHNLVLLVPQYVPEMDASEGLQDCFETIDQDRSLHRDGISNVTDCMTEYINLYRITEYLSFCFPSNLSLGSQVICRRSKMTRTNWKEWSVISRWDQKSARISTDWRINPSRTSGMRVWAWSRLQASISNTICRQSQQSGFVLQ